MKLELRTHRFGEAIITEKKLEEAGADAATVTELQAVIAQLDKVRTDDSSYEVTDEMTDGTWVFYPLKRHFRAAVSRAGYISDVKLRCDKSYVFFAFDPTLNYEIHPKDGKCSMELEGAPGTHFVLTSF